MGLDQLCGAARREMAIQLARKHHRQITDRVSPIPSDTYAITFRPGDRTATFAGKLLRPIGSSVLVGLWYETSDSDQAPAFEMPLRGYHLDFAVDGSASYGAQSGPLFDLEVVLSPGHHASGRRLGASRHLSLLDLVLRMDRLCGNLAGRHRRLPVIPEFPRILLGFAPNQPPQFEDTPALRRIAACKLDLPLERLGSNGQLLLNRLLDDVWQEQLLLPGQGANHTSLILIDAELCTQVRASLRVFEDFSKLVGVSIRNPAKTVQPIQAANPAKQVLREYSIDTTQNFCQRIMPETVDTMVTRMRELIGPQEKLFTTEEIMDGLTAPEVPLSAWSYSLPQLRTRLGPYFGEVTTGGDLLRACREPEKPLYASGACRIQVLRKRRAAADSLLFSQSDLGRRLTVNLRTGHAPAAMVGSTVVDSDVFCAANTPIHLPTGGVPATRC
jgi:hypothetical protein